MITIIGGGFAGLSAAYFLHRAGKDVTVLEWSRGLGGRAATRNVGYRTVDSGAQRLDLSPLSVNQLETDARALLREVAAERGALPYMLPFPGPVYRFDGRSIATAQQVDVPNWSFMDGGMKVLAEALVKDIPVRTHTRISDIVFEENSYTLRNQRGETMQSEGIVIALPAPYALALLLPHAATNKKVKKVCDLLNEVNYEPMIGAIFGTEKINFKEQFSALFTDDVTAPVFWLSQESARRNLGVRRNEMAFVLQLGADISREYVLKTDKETFAAIERVFEDVLDVALPDVIYGEIQRWPAAFLSSSPLTVDSIKPSDFKVPLYLAGDFVAGQSSIASAFWSGKQIADKLVGMDTFKFIAEPAREQAQLSAEEWKAAVPPERTVRKARQKPPRKLGTKKKFDAATGKRVPQTKEPKQQPRRNARPAGGPPGRGGDRRQPAFGGPRGGGGQRGGFAPRQGGGPRQGGRPGGPPRQGPPRQGGFRPAGGAPRDNSFQPRGGAPRQFTPRPAGGPPQREWGGGQQGRPQRTQGGPPREGGYQRQGGYQQGGGGGYQQGGGGYQRGGGGGGYQQGGGRNYEGGGYQQGGGGYQQGGGYQGGGGYQRGGGAPQRGSGGGGYQQRPPSGGGYRGRPQGGGQRPPGGGGQRGPARDYDQRQPTSSGYSGPGERKPVRGSVVYSTNVRPAGGSGPASNSPQRPRRPFDDESVGNR